VNTSSHHEEDLLLLSHLEVDLLEWEMCRVGVEWVGTTEGTMVVVVVVESMLLLLGSITTAVVVVE
jgi:hypothetical protein